MEHSCVGSRGKRYTLSDLLHLGVYAVFPCRVVVRAKYIL